MAYTVKNKKLRIAFIIIAVLVPFPRMYVGVHTPLDVLVAAGMALVLIFALRPVVFERDGKYFPVLLGAMTVTAAAFLCFVEFYPFPADIDEHNLASGIKNAYTLLGALLGLLLVYVVDEKWLKFSTKAVWWAQIIKSALGLLLVLAVKSGLKVPLNAMFGESVGRAARYILIVVVAGIVWPLTFKWFARLGKKK